MWPCFLFFFFVARNEMSPFSRCLQKGRNIPIKTADKIHLARLKLQQAESVTGKVSYFTGSQVFCWHLALYIFTYTLFLVMIVLNPYDNAAFLTPAPLLYVYFYVSCHLHVLETQMPTICDLLETCLSNGFSCLTNQTIHKHRGWWRLNLKTARCYTVLQ